MRCGCFECGAYMVQAESMALGCVCPECGYRCRACMGTNTMMDREAVRSLKKAHDAAELGDGKQAEAAERLGRMALVEQQLRMMEKQEEMGRDEKPGRH